MMAETDVVLSYPWQDHDIGDRITIDTHTAKRLVRAGVALYATKKDATGAGDNPEKSATVRKRG
jgi:hypothetical protein